MKLVEILYSDEWQDDCRYDELERVWPLWMNCTNHTIICLEEIRKATRKFSQV